MASNSPLNRDLRILEQYVAYSPPGLHVVEDAERGRDVPYEDRWSTELFSWLSSGRSIVEYCQQPGKPARSLILSWVQDRSPQFDTLRERFEAGLRNRALALVDDAGLITDEPIPLDGKGCTDVVAMSDKRQRTETKLRLAALLDPAKFAPTAKGTTVNLTQVNVTQRNVAELTDEQLRQVLDEAARRRAAGAVEPRPAVSAALPQLPTPPRP